MYIKRLIDRNIEKELEAFGAVLITGPKWCGKTTTGLHQAKSAIFPQDPDERENVLSLADMKPSLLLEGEKPRLIDEWQDAPKLWDAVRFTIDRSGESGQYILTGSTTIDESQIAHTGTGRISRVRMRTMSLFESGSSNGDVRLSELLHNKDIGAKSDLELSDIADHIVGGGWPSSINKDLSIKKRQVAGYCRSIINTEISTSDGKERDAQKVEYFLRSYSRHLATQAALSTMSKDINAHYETVDRKTISEYIRALQAIFVIEELEAWSPALRSKKAIATTPTRHFVDPAIAAYFLNANSNDLLFDIKTFRLLFESLVIRDLRVYAETLEGRVYHYRDHSGREADAIIHFDTGEWGAVEVKLGSKAIDTGAANLLKLTEDIDTEIMRAPSFLAVITATGYAYKRKDGVYVIPIGCLRN